MEQAIDDNPPIGEREARVGRVARRFTMRDGMILVASMAIAFGMFHAIDRLEGATSYRWLSYLELLVVILATITPTTLALRLLGPRPKLPKLCRQPGFVAGLAGSAMLALGVLATGIVGIIRLAKGGMINAWGRPALTPNPLWWWSVVVHFGAMIGPAVIAGWLLLALSGHRRPPGDWLDNLGRGIGAVWIVLFVINCGARLANLIG